MTTTQRHSQPLNLRISPDVRRRLDNLVNRFDLTVTSVSRIALVIGIETLEGLEGEAPKAFPSDPGST